MSTWFALVLGPLLLQAPGKNAAPPKAAEPAAERLVESPRTFLKITLPPLEEIKALDAKDDADAVWSGRLHGTEVAIVVWRLSRAKLGIESPEDALEIHVEWIRENAPAFEFGELESLSGSYGIVPTGAWTHTLAGSPQTGTAPQSPPRYLLAGLLESSGYVIDVLFGGPASANAEAAVVEMFKKGIRYTGPVPSPKWTDEEAKKRWERDAPDDLRSELKTPFRTAHYLVLTNSSGGDAFARKMEECYAAIRKTYPFPELAGQKLMPVFLFRTAEQYYAFYAKVAQIPVEQARKSKGHAWRDYYATYYEAPNDPVHIHEATHQIFANRLRLGGGGSWFQEGVAEYMSSKRPELAGAARAVKKGRHTPLGEFIKIPSLLYSAKEDRKGGDEATDHYSEAALLIEFLRESPFGKAKFDRFLKTLGRVRRNDADAIDAGFRKVYGVGTKEVEEQWRKYCENR
ncbi:MAG: hypothetical protein JNJ88_00105 [Planctomycetes bacterium]|nr:hypothetical protein [Planctomycetota bacterium]